ncbi:MAG: hypothetical protein Q7J84_04005 [Sulfuricaulis sp.]|nr:hypothetical protein [Sulfuricaulis sp.]
MENPTGSPEATGAWALVTAAAGAVGYGIWKVIELVQKQPSKPKARVVTEDDVRHIIQEHSVAMREYTDKRVAVHEIHCSNADRMHSEYQSVMQQLAAQGERFDAMTAAMTERIDRLINAVIANTGNRG